MLLPDAQCLFRYRQFPTSLVTSSDLQEAIALDLEQWLPADNREEMSWLYLSEQQGDSWQVAVWSWSNKLSEGLLAALPATISCTHILPAMAWYAMQHRSEEPSLLLSNSHGATSYALVAPSGIPQAIAWPSDHTAAQRFWRGLGVDTNKVNHAWWCNTPDPASWIPQRLAAAPLVTASARNHLLQRARLPGVRDWSDPASWRRPITVLLALLALWILADAAVLMQRSNQVDQALTSARQAAHQVLQQRDQVEQSQQQLQRIAHLRQLQQRPEQLLAALSQTIPHDIWLDVVQLDRGWIDMNGRGKEVARLLVLLETIPSIKRVILLNDIRPDAHTGLEQFQLRLVLQ